MQLYLSVRTLSYHPSIKRNVLFELILILPSLVVNPFRLLIFPKKLMRSLELLILTKVRSLIGVENFQESKKFSEDGFR